MAETDDTNPIAAAAQVDPAAETASTGSGKSALRRKVVGRGQTSLSSPSPIVLPDEGLVTKTIVPTPAVTSDEGSKVTKPEPAPVTTANISAELTTPTPRPRKSGPVVATPSVDQPRTKAKPIEPEAPKPTHAKLPAAIAAAATAPAGKVSANLAATSRPALRAPRITKPASTHTPSSPVFSTKDFIMDTSANFSGFQDAMAQAQTKAQAAFEKSSNMLGEAGEFAKGNVEAMIESSKILAGGVQEMGSSLVSESRTAFEAMTGDIKELAAAKSPTDFLKLQSEMVRKNFDSAVAQGSKNTETLMKLMSDAFAPLSGRVSLAVEKARQVAPLGMPATAAAI